MLLVHVSFLFSLMYQNLLVVVSSHIEAPSQEGHSLSLHSRKLPCLLIHHYGVVKALSRKLSNKRLGSTISICLRNYLF